MGMVRLVILWQGVRFAIGGVRDLTTRGFVTQSGASSSAPDPVIAPEGAPVSDKDDTARMQLERCQGKMAVLEKMMDAAENKEKKVALAQKIDEVIEELTELIRSQQTTI